jgi:hypothetical protein
MHSVDDLRPGTVAIATGRGRLSTLQWPNAPPHALEGEQDALDHFTYSGACIAPGVLPATIDYGPRRGYFCLAEDGPRRSGGMSAQRSADWKNNKHCYGAEAVTKTASCTGGSTTSCPRPEKHCSGPSKHSYRPTSFSDLMLVQPMWNHSTAQSSPSHAVVIIKLGTARKASLQTYLSCYRRIQTRHSKTSEQDLHPMLWLIAIAVHLLVFIVCIRSAIVDGVGGWHRKIALLVRGHGVLGTQVGRWIAGRGRVEFVTQASDKVVDTGREVFFEQLSQQAFRLRVTCDPCCLPVCPSAAHCMLCAKLQRSASPVSRSSLFHSRCQ